MAHRDQSPGSPPRAGGTAWAWVVVVVAWSAYLVLDLIPAADTARILVKAVLMPCLLLWVLVSLGGSAPRLLLAGLALATVGDVGLEFDATFILGMASFLAMQVCYVLGFIGLGAWPAVRRRWPIAAGYLAFWVAVNAVLGPLLEDLRIPILVYSLALCVMAVFAAGVDSRVGVGGLLFLVSDMLIGLDLAGLGFPGRGVVVMVTYLAAQYLIATGWVRQVRPEVPLPI